MRNHTRFRFLSNSIDNHSQKMLGHDSYDLILSASLWECKSEDTKNLPLSFEHTADETKQEPSGHLPQTPKWFYEQRNNVDEVKLELPGIDMKDVALVASETGELNKKLVVSAIRYRDNENKRDVQCEFFFKMRLADENDTNAVTSNYSHGVLSISIPRMQKEFKKIVPAFAYNKKVDVEEVTLELLGVKREDITYDVEHHVIFIRAWRYDETDGRKVPEVEFLFTFKAASNSDLSKIRTALNGGLFTVRIPRTSGDT